MGGSVPEIPYDVVAFEAAAYAHYHLLRDTTGSPGPKPGPPCLDLILNMTIKTRIAIHHRTALPALERTLRPLQEKHDRGEL